MNNEENLSNSNRRDFIKKASVIAGVTIAPGIVLHSVSQAKSPDEAVSNKTRWGLLVDTTKCAEGCDVCVQACKTEHGLTGHDRPTTDPQWIRKIGLKDKMTGKTYSLPMMCQHCEYPPCADVCPTGASFKREDGIVLVDKHICIGCRYCMMACPYKARSFVHEVLEDQKPHSPRGKGTVEACTLCTHRVDNGQQPACVEACPSKAMLFGDLNDEKSDIAKALKAVNSMALRPSLELNPGVRYQGL